jgi:hypothetical protein
MTVFTPDSSKIEHERRLLDFEELLPQRLPMNAGTFRALLVILDHVDPNKASDEISDAWHALLAWVDDCC